MAIQLEQCTIDHEVWRGHAVDVENIGHGPRRDIGLKLLGIRRRHRLIAERDVRVRRPELLENCLEELLLHRGGSPPGESNLSGLRPGAPPQKRWRGKCGCGQGNRADAVAGREEPVLELF
jgi:hypothetical protein